MVYDSADNGDKFSKKNVVLGRLRSHPTSHLKVSPGLARISKIVSVYMVYLQEISHQFQINVIIAFIINLEINLVHFLNVLGFLLWTSGKTEAIRFYFDIF